MNYHQVRRNRRFGIAIIRLPPLDFELSHSRLTPILNQSHEVLKFQLVSSLSNIPFNVEENPLTFEEIDCLSFLSDKVGTHCQQK